jgi:hypothetical protein
MQLLGIRFIIVIAVIVILAEITVRDRDLKTSSLRDRDRDLKNQSRSTLFVVLYETLTKTYEVSNKLFEGFVVLYETKKGFRIRCKLINLLMVSYVLRNPF